MAFAFSPILSEQQAGFYSFPKANIVRPDRPLFEGAAESEKGSLHLMRIQINLGVSKYRRQFFDAIGGAALREFIRKILRVVVGKLHNINEFLADPFYVVPSCYCWA